jgi:4a-hydroxytetrahydrobiopterin dehydratase
MNISFTNEKKFAATVKDNTDALSSSGWKETKNKLHKKFEFKNFSEAFAFMTRVALAAEKMDHHPEWKNVWNTVEFWLSTHDAGDIVTEKDKKLASKIDSLIN